MFIISGIIIGELKFIDGNLLYVYWNRREEIMTFLTSSEKMAFTAPKKLSRKKTPTNKQTKKIKNSYLNARLQKIFPGWILNTENNFLCQIRDLLKLLIFCDQLQREQDLPCKIIQRAATIYRQLNLWQVWLQQLRTLERQWGVWVKYSDKPPIQTLQI